MNKWKYMITGGIIGGSVSTYICSKAIKSDHERMESMVDRLDSYYHLLVQWMRNKYNGWNISDYFSDKEYRKIAIYGMGEIGDLLYNDLKEAGISVEYSIDQVGGSYIKELPGYTLRDELPEVDAIIITPIFAIEDIMNSLRRVTSAQLISVQEIIYNG